MSAYSATTFDTLRVDRPPSRPPARSGRVPPPAASAPCSSHPLKRIRRCPRLERASAQHACLQRSRTWAAISRIWPRLSTEQGPAMRTTSGPPSTVPFPSRTRVFSSRHSRETCLYGLLTLMTSRTPGRPTNRASCTRPSLPTSPIADALVAEHGLGPVAHLVDRVDHPLDLVRGGLVVHDDQHGYVSPVLEGRRIILGSGS